MYPQVLSIPYGFDLIDGKLKENLHEQRIIANMQLWRSQGESYDSISDKLNLLNIPTKRDKIWWGAMVNKILKRKGENNYDKK